jgi:hypothetical protein
VNYESVKQCLETVAGLANDERRLFLRGLLDSCSFEDAVFLIGHSTARMSDIQAQCRSDRSEYALCLSLNDDTTLAFRARRIRALLHSKMYYGTKYESALKEEFRKLVQNPEVAEYLKLMSLSID